MGRGGEGGRGFDEIVGKQYLLHLKARIYTLHENAACD